MGLFDKIKNGVLSFVNDDFLSAITAACSLVAFADGEATDDEKEKMFKYMRINDDLKRFKLSQVEEKYEKYSESLNFDINLGKIECYKAIESIKDNRENSQKLIAVCIAIAKSDGKIDSDEKNVILEIIRRLGLNSNYFTF